MTTARVRKPWPDNSERAEDLVQEGRLMRQSLAAQGESATTNFMDEVETVLTEAAHTPDGTNARPPNGGSIKRWT